MKATVYIGTGTPRTPAVEALRHEHAAVVCEFKAMTFALMEKTGWSEGTAMLVMEHLILAYEIGASLRERRVGTKMKGKKLTAPPEALVRPWREVIVVTGDERAAALVEQAFLLGWKRNKPRNATAPKKTAGATFAELVSGRGQLDKRERCRLRKRLDSMAQEFRSRSQE